MKIALVFALLGLIIIVKGNLIAAIARPTILSIGTIFAALNQDRIDIKHIEWRNIMAFSKEKTEKPT